MVGRGTFSNTNPLPLPKSMQPNFEEMEFEQNMPFDHRRHQNGIMPHANPTIPLQHFNKSGESFLGPHDGPFSQEGGGGGGHLSGDGFDGYFSTMPQVQPSNMVIGDMQSFASTLSEESQYFESLLHGQMNSQVK